MLICLGGVCVPYTAVVPIIILGLKWILEKLGLGQYLPKFLQDMLQVQGGAVASSSSSTTDKCCSSETAVSKGGPSKVQPLESMEEYQDLLSNSGSKVKVVLKFTSTWCQPCKRVQPFFEQCSSQPQYQKKKDGSNVLFRTIDVDEFDEISNKYKVSMMPTFLVLQGDKVLGTYSGSNEHELDVFLKENAGAA
mmetsp:Transcript_22617/g.55911  ORF Transcript_22617/g.55911 Transcript_22617/m.55911 type:complete len:193 (-) Transcript_22617:146-724(-)|eukprot:CAMPEP_0113628372 /NCGR_PEP_ID=MMETSP0017_2-20120614/14700_1 /TAXON_ID=2856 /ORGANISM="Cylindrotheca closterium" /LENGTH=192 /DNA_ID=CAMNT_0000538673 /DNA_START=42 /DNA_END=620 /DNA_ORIENTATION=+ /assembly_acc=CAM_ASM_000147